MIAIVTHGGVGSPKRYSDGCRDAARRGMDILRNGGAALDAVVTAAISLEDDGRFNAGSGAAVRLDGKTIEMDAALMDSTGKIGAVAAVRNVKNPILVAKEVLSTPHLFICGSGATDLAACRGLALPSPLKPSPHAQKRFKKNVEQLSKRKGLRDIRKEWRTFDIQQHWNFGQTAYEDIFGHSDTIGAVAIDSHGTMASAVSTGGTSITLQGRVGDSPIIGCGFYAGSHAAVATTGIGEEIIKRLLAKAVYDFIAGGMSAQKACAKGLTLFPKSIPIGVIAVSPRGVACAANRQIAHGIVER